MKKSTKSKEAVNGPTYMEVTAQASECPENSWLFFVQQTLKVREGENKKSTQLFFFRNPVVNTLTSQANPWFLSTWAVCLSSLYPQQQWLPACLPALHTAFLQQILVPISPVSMWHCASWWLGAITHVHVYILNAFINYDGNNGNNKDFTSLIATLNGN
jgi:hypothetical protein